MSIDAYEIRLCQNPECGLRYPQVNTAMFGIRCPSCLAETKVEFRKNVFPRPNNCSNHQISLAQGTRNEVIPLLDNIRSAWNVGSIFRTAGGLGLSKLYLCGITPTPDNKSVCKTAMGEEENVKWEYSPNALNTAIKLKTEGSLLIALEQDPRAIIFNQFSIPKSQSSTLVLGNEVIGVDPDLLDLCDHIVYIPMRGKNQSFNVEVAFAIAVYTLLNDKNY